MSSASLAEKFRLILEEHHDPPEVLAEKLSYTAWTHFRLVVEAGKQRELPPQSMQGDTGWENQ